MDHLYDYGVVGIDEATASTLQTAYPDYTVEFQADEIRITRVVGDCQMTATLRKSLDVTAVISEDGVASKSIGEGVILSTTMKYPTSVIFDSSPRRWDEPPGMDTLIEAIRVALLHSSDSPPAATTPRDIQKWFKKTFGNMGHPYDNNRPA